MIGDFNKITWFGHSAFMLEMDGKTLLVDPMFGKAPTPFPLFGNKRFSRDLPIDLERLPPIDAVLLSHDHYDHLDYYSIKKLKDKVGQFIVPLGLGAILKDGALIKKRFRSIIGGMKLITTACIWFARLRDIFPEEVYAMAIQLCGAPG